MANYLDEIGLLKLWSKIKTYIAGHTGNKNNPHSVSKSQVGLGNVENKSSSTIRSEITSSNVTSALGYTPISNTGGTLSGTALFEFADSGNWSNGSNPTYPVIRGGFRWSGQSDAVKLYAEETGRDNLELILLFTDDNSNGLTIRNAAGQTTARITANGNFSGSFTGNISGNAGSANSVPWSGVTGKPSTYTPSSHTHNYAGSGSAGGSANSAVKLDTNAAGSATQPVYFANGKPTACTYTLGKSVPSNAVFTDTNTWRGIQNNLTSDATDQSLSAAQGKALNTNIVNHTSNKSNPHGVTKTQIGLSNAENKSSATIRSELTASNVNAALGYTAAKQTDMDNTISGISASGTTLIITQTDGTTKYVTTELVKGQMIYCCSNNADQIYCC